MAKLDVEYANFTSAMAEKAATIKAAQDALTAVTTTVSTTTTTTAAKRRKRDGNRNIFKRNN